MMHMDNKQQLKVLSQIWGNDRRGYIFMPYIKGSAKTKLERKRSWTEGSAFRWPQDKVKILQHLAHHENDDLYFTPNLFGSPQRQEVFAEPERSLWADLDEVDPTEIDDKYRPTIAWQSSPGRYQAVWILDRPLVGASWPGKENQRLTDYLGADPSGYDTTQLLRIPGRPNYKPEYRVKGKPAPGKLLWDRGPRYVWTDFEDLPELQTIDIREMESLDEELLNSINRHEVWAKVRLKVSSRIREFMASSTPEGADRSAVLWEIERDLAKAGCTMAEIVVLVRGSVWNKFAGRANEIMTLKTRASRALSLIQDSPIEPLSEEKPDIRWLSDVVAQGIPRPRWLVKGIWTRGSCGFIAGDPKSYKSWLGMDLALSVASGRPFLGCNDYILVGKPQPVLILQEEDDLALVVDRLQQIVEARCPELFWHGQLSLSHGKITWSPPKGTLPIALHVATGFAASDEVWQAWLDTTLAQGQFKFVLIDTLGTTAGSVDTDRSYEVMSKILNPLKVLAKKHDSAMAIVHHNRKDTSNTGARAGKKMLGSVALHAWVESALYVSKLADQRIAVESETKQAMGHSFSVDIPALGVMNDIRTLWTPVVDPEIVPERTNNNAGRNHTNDNTWSSQDRLGWKIRSMMSSSSGRTREQLMSALGTKTVESFDKQMEALIKSEYVRVEDHKYFLRKALR